jgi:hypothetical protein
VGGQVGNAPVEAIDEESEINSSEQDYGPEESQHSEYDEEQQQSSDDNDGEYQVSIFEDFILLQELMCVELMLRIISIRKILRTSYDQDYQSNNLPLYLTDPAVLKKEIKEQLDKKLQDRIFFLHNHRNDKKVNKSRLGLNMIP